MADGKNILDEETTDKSNQTDDSVASDTIEEVFAEADETDESVTEANEEVSIDDQLKAANEKNAELEAKLVDAENRYYRLQADFDNSRRRARLDLEASEKYRAQSLISDLLPAMDNFERGLQLEADNEQTKSLLQGMEMVYRSLLEALKNEGAEQIEAVGKEFDPTIHQAVMQVEEGGFDSNTVVEEFQKGYMLKDRVIRPAMVKVNQ
ncbi:nucleotide exchange factor GrpE [Bacillus sp. FJAT-29790]|uniref:nucleotide exchange factor GrpE n=1 Tax=Bacillus sp. FJAT-29790 TaxID=1895002 RepID=UPI001C2211F7|nr:nucleotide exchange factor GrpE [Bacillus sp. FJAT-29790]MBU8879449.1 nucleotide exchange factor GrpE [Bacillus sp. FJAT-29790]